MNTYDMPRGGTRRGEITRLDAVVKWFNRSKGFGFASLTDGTGDVFLPLSALEQAGIDDVAEGATLVCDVVDGAKGRAVIEVIEIDTSTAGRSIARSGRGGGQDRGGQDRGGDPAGGGRGSRDERAPGPVEPLDGVVKWFDAIRGFGFISPFDGGKDVFIHVSALRRSGLEMIETGQNVRMMVAEARRGREASSVQIL
jgi:CspA family cold shock protein